MNPLWIRHCCPLNAGICVMYQNLMNWLEVIASKIPPPPWIDPSDTSCQSNKALYFLPNSSINVEVIHWLSPWYVRHKKDWICRGGSRISGKGVCMHKGMGSLLCWFFSHFSFLKIPWKWNNLVSLRPIFFIFMGYLKTGACRRVQENPLWIHHWFADKHTNPCPTE